MLLVASETGRNLSHNFPTQSTFTTVFALFMVIIGAFIGTEDLGQYILKALSDKNGAGIGLTLGICVAFIGLIFDRIKSHFYINRIF